MLIDSFYDRSRHSIWRGDQSVRYLISRGIPDGVSGGPVVNAAGLVVGIGAKGPGDNDHPLTPSEVVPVSAVFNALRSDVWCLS
jgi:S1-C subfamily serine protease